MPALWSALLRFFTVLLIAVAGMAVIVAVGGLLMMYFLFQPSRDEVAREASPDGAVVATLIEINGGATTDFGYEVKVDGTRVALLYGAVRNSNAYGVNLRWLSSSDLDIEYLATRRAGLEKPELRVGTRTIHVALKPNVTDATAPAGGMLYNLEKGN
jgi:hypothetical protein